MSAVSSITTVTRSVVSILFPTARGFKLFKFVSIALESTDPVVVIKNVTLTVVTCCTAIPATVAIAANCIGAGSVLVASATTPNPITIGAFLHLINEIYEKCVK